MGVEMLGKTAIDRITGFSGLVVAFTEVIHNMDRVCLQPRALGEDGQPKKPVWFDLCQVEFGDYSDVTVIPATVIAMKIGDEVEDTLSNMKGTVVGISTYLNGCLRLGVQPKELKDGIPVDEAWLPPAQLKLIKAKVEINKPRSGGPGRSPKERSGARG